MVKSITNQNINKFTKEMLDMTYPDEYYKNTIQPAKAGTGPVPSKMQMASKAQPFKAMMIGMDPYLPGFMQQGYDKVRAAPTGPARTALGAGSGILRTALSAPMTAGALAQQGLYSLNKPSTQAGYDYAQNLDRNSISSIADETAGLDYQQDYMQGVMDADFGAMTQPKPSDIAQSNNPYDYFSVDAQTADEQAQLPIDPLTPQRSMFSKAMDFMPFIGDKSLTGMATRGIGNLFSGLDQFDTLPIEDQEFILEQAGGNRPSKDAFGINRRSAFGNYAQYVRDKGIFAKGKRGEYYRNISGLDQALMDTLDREQKAKAAYEQQIKDAANEASRNAARARSITAGYGGSDDSRGATGPTASGAGMGVGGGYASDYQGADGGSVPTGLASMFVEKR